MTIIMNENNVKKKHIKVVLVLCTVVCYSERH